MSRFSSSEKLGQLGSRYGSKVSLITALVAMTIAYQNCGPSFSVSQFASETVEPLAVPTLNFKSAVPSLSNSKSMNIEFTAKLDRRTTLQSATCQLDAAAPVDCTSGVLPLSALTDGDHTIKINAVDSRGQRTEELIALFRIDSTPPTLTVTERPAAVTGTTTARFSMVASDTLSDVTAVECSLDTAVYAPCQSMSAHSMTVTAGARAFHIRARDRAGNVSAEYNYAWTVDLTAPIVNIVKPADFIGSRSISIAFSGTDDGMPITSFECQLDNSGYTACTSPMAYNNTLTEGLRTFSVRGRDTAGNLSSPQSVSFTVDTVAPTAPTVTTALTSPTRVTTPQIAFTSTDATSGVMSYQCAVDAGAFSTCTSPFTYAALQDGSRALRVKAFDRAGNESTVGSTTLVIDTAPPTITFSATQVPPASTTDTVAVFGFTTSDSGSGVRFTDCQLDGGSFATCSSPASFTVGVGSHTLVVRATDNANNMASSTRTWTVTATAPPPSPTATPTPSPTIPPPPTTGGLVIDLSYVNQASPQYTRFKGMVDAALAGNPDYGFEPQHAALMYKITNDVRYCDYAITYAENCAASRYAEPNCGVQGAEAAIAAGGRPPVSGDSYLEVGPIIGSIAITYDWCSARMTAAQRTRWSNYANQAIQNVWNPNTATWGGRSYPWSGWSIDNPGNNYYYSFLEATMYWALASRNSTMLTLTRSKLQALTDYYARIPGGGSLEGTGYGASHMRLFYLYQVWKDSTGTDLANINSHLTDSIRFWVHATTPNRAYYAPVGDLARSSFPDLFDYHRRIMLEARRLTNNATAQDLASWWLNHISVPEMSRRIDGQWDLMPAGNNTAAAPNEPLSYRATGVGRVFARTGWDTNAMWMSFNAGPYVESHAHQDQGSFTLANNAFLAVTNNIYSSSGIEQTSDFHNVIRFQQGATIIPQREGTTSTMTVNQLDALGNADITANLTPAYGGNAAVQNWTRNVRFMNRTLTVTDNFAVSSGTQGIFQLHVPVQPVVNGNLITAGTLRVRVISPATPTITVVNQGRFRIDISGGTTGYTVELKDQ